MFDRSKGQAGLRKGSTDSTRPQRGTEGAKDILHLNQSKRWSRLTSAATRGSLNAETRRRRDQWKIRIKRKIKIKSFGQKGEAREILDTDYADDTDFLTERHKAAKRHKRRNHISTEANGGNKEGKSNAQRTQGAQRAFTKPKPAPFPSLPSVTQICSSNVDRITRISRIL